MLSGFFYGQLGIMWRLQVPRLGEGGETAVVGLLCFRGKTAAGKLFAFEVVLQAVTANAFFAARVSAAAEIHVLFFFTFHHNVLSCFL